MRTYFPGKDEGGILIAAAVGMFLISLLLASFVPVVSARLHAAVAGLDAVIARNEEKNARLRLQYDLP